VKFFVRASILLSMLLLSGCSDGWCWPFECSSSKSSSGVVDDSAGSANVAAENPFDNQIGGAFGTTASKLFKLEFKQTSMACGACGWWFDSTQLVIQHSAGKFVKNGGLMFIKKGSNRIGHFSADISSIPSSATIQSATLYMRFNAHEGIANSDNSSVVVVYGWLDASKSKVRDITAKKDIKGKGYSKSNPNLPIDFTAYAQKVH
jgi:hypothetical protein